eukprot:GHVN01031385.1.p1 GENE.GHVN01031385.1~~GHVN01031385.1.p1  ORF type:complete len:266 (+),score=57.45 GHVN01031385.1:190-987(+)
MMKIANMGFFVLWFISFFHWSSCRPSLVGAQLRRQTDLDVVPSVAQAEPLPPDSFLERVDNLHTDTSHSDTILPDFNNEGGKTAEEAASQPLGHTTPNEPPSEEHTLPIQQPHPVPISATTIPPSSAASVEEPAATLAGIGVSEISVTPVDHTTTTTSLTSTTTSTLPPPRSQAPQPTAPFVSDDVGLHAAVPIIEPGEQTPPAVSEDDPRLDSSLMVVPFGESEVEGPADAYHEVDQVTSQKVTEGGTFTAGHVQPATFDNVSE